VKTSLKTKILLLTILPTVMVFATITWMYQRQAHELSTEQLEIIEDNLMASKRAALQDYVNLAMNSIAPVLEEMDDGLEPALAEYRIKYLLRGLSYGSDGYFFAYTPDGINLVHPIQLELEGQNLMEFQDDNGQFVIRDLLEVAASGGGFYQYIWRKPTDGLDRNKLSYVVQIPQLGWMMGTGLYVDNIARETADMKQEVADNIRRSFWASAVLLVVTLSVVVLIVTLVNMHTTQLADQHLQQLANRFVTFQVMQRRTFARELHDGINQLLVSTKLRLNLANRQWPELQAREHLGKALEQLDISIQEVRRISHNLRPVMLDDLGFEAALHGMLDELEDQGDISISRRIRLPRERLPDAIEMTLYRVLQEGMTNIRKHALATHVTLSVTCNRHTISLRLADNGCGIDQQADPTGIGLMNMRERVELLGGKFSIVSRPERGTLIKAQFELDPDPQPAPDTARS